MKTAINKCLIIIIIISLIFNIFQYTNYKIKIDQRQKQNEVLFKLKLQNTIYNIKNLKTSTYDTVVNVSILSYSLGEVCSLCEMTSYSNKNRNLLPSLLALKDIFANNNKLTELLNNTDFHELLSFLNKVKDNPLDEKSAEDLYNISIKIR